MEALGLHVQHEQVLAVAVFPKKIQWLLLSQCYSNLVEESQAGQSVPSGAGERWVEPGEGW